MVFSLQESGLSRWVGERFSGVHGGVLVAGVGPVAVGGGGSGLVVYMVVFSLQESGLWRWGGAVLWCTRWCSRCRSRACRGGWGAV